jgi:apolipoprotein N-acyltransferase
MQLNKVRLFLEKAAAVCRAQQGLRRYLASLVAGVLVALAFAPYYVLPGLVIAFPILIWLLDGASLHARQKRVSFWVGWWFAFGYLFPSLYWLAFSFIVHATGPGHFALLALAGFTGVAGLSGFIACFYGLAVMAAVRWFWTDGWIRIIALALFWSVAEVARSYLFTGLPWNLMGQSFAGMAVLSQLAAYIGPFGLGLVVLLMAVAPAAMIHRSGTFFSYWPALLMLAALGDILIIGFLRLGLGPVVMRGDVMLQIVQPSIVQQDKINPEKFADNFVLTAGMSGGENLSDVPPGKQLYVIWPENAAYQYFQAGREAYQHVGQRLPDGALLFSGAVRSEVSPTNEIAYFNSMLLIGQGPTPDGGGERQWLTLNTYDKHHLAPFGEYVPLVGFFRAIGIGNLVPLGVPFTPGEGPRTLPLGLTRVSPIICYETIFTDKVYPRDDRPDWLLTVTNDAWFGDSAGPQQHLDMARLRSIESGLPMARSANTGVSALIGPRGRLLETVPLYQRGSIVSALPEAAPMTFYGRFSHTLYILMLMGLGALVISKRRNN